MILELEFLFLVFVIFTYIFLRKRYWIKYTMGSSSSKSSSEIHADSTGVGGSPNLLTFATFYSRASDDEFLWFGNWVMRDSGGYHAWNNALNKSGMYGTYAERISQILDARGEYNWIDAQYEYGNRHVSSVKSSSVQVSTVQSSPAVVCTSEVVIVTPVTSTIATTKTTSAKKTTRNR